MHILVTGGAGFIGSHVVDALLADGHDLTVLDNFDAFYDRAIKEHNIAEHRKHPRWRLITLDLRDSDSLLRLDGPFDAIVHLAAKAGVRPSIADPLTYQEVNVRGTQNLLELARTLKVPQFVFASSSSVYGHLYGIRFVALRLFAVYGPRQRPDLALHRFAQAMAAGRQIPLFGDGTTTRDYTYIGDIVAGVRSALRYDRSNYEVINLGNNQTVTLLDMVRCLESALGMKAAIQQLPEQPGDVRQTCASIAKAHGLLGYVPSTPFDEGVRRFVQWFTAAVER
jgi:UDP-glucuronate 4-epimerase